MTFPSAVVLLGQDGLFLFLVVAIVFLTVTIFVFAITSLILRFRNALRRKRWLRLEEKWEPVFMDVLVEAKPLEALWDLVETGEELSFLTYLLRYSRLVKGRERAVVDALACRYLDHAVPYSLSRMAERRARAIQMLGDLGIPQFSSPVIAALDDPSPLVAMIAASALMARPSEEFSTAVLARLDRFTQWRPTYLAALMAAPGPSAGPRLREALADRTRSPAVRRVAAIALTFLNDHLAAAPACVVASEETDRDLVASSLRLLAHVGHSEHLPVVRARMDSPDEILRGAAARALGSLGIEEDRERLHRAALDDPSKWVALNAARALLNTQGRSLLEALSDSDHSRSPLAVQVLTEGGAS